MERPDNQAGTVSLEFALVIPLLMVLIFATVTLGHSLYVRYMLASAASTVARTCVLEQATVGTCEAVAQPLVADANRWCTGGVGVSVQSVELPGLVYVAGLKVELHCDFVGGFGSEYLRNSNVTIADFTVSALMPYSRPEPVP